MSVLVPSLTNNHHTSMYFSNNPTRRMNGNISQPKSNVTKTENEQESDHVPHGVVNSMKQRLLNKVKQSFSVNNNSNVIRHPLTKTSLRVPSNENLLQTKTSISPLKHTARLSRSQDNLTNHQTNLNEQFTSYIQPKQELIIVDTTTNDHENDNKLSTGKKSSVHRQSYTELHVDEAPKPGTVTTVKNMFERQIRLSRYDADKLINVSTPASSRMNSQHREIPSPSRSRSISPNDMAVRQRRTSLPGTAPSTTSTILSLPVPASYPDLVISHTPPTEKSKAPNEQIHNDNSSTSNQAVVKDKRVNMPNRNAIVNEQTPLSVIVDETPANTINHNRLNLLLPTTITPKAATPSETIDCQPLDFKSRLALFNRTDTQKSNENYLSVKKSAAQTNCSLTNTSIKLSVQQPARLLNEEKTEPEYDSNQEHQTLPVSRSVVNTANAVTFFGGKKLNGNSKSSLPKSIAPPPPPPPSSSSSSTVLTNSKIEQTTVSTTADVFRVPDVIGGNVKLMKSSLNSGARKDVRVQFIENVDTFEYPSFEVALAEFGGTYSDSDNEMENERNGDDDDDDDDDDLSSADSIGANNNNINTNGKTNGTQNETSDNMKQIYDVDDDELDRLAHINAQFNTNNLTEKPLKPKGTLHTFRPTHLDQYELGTQHGSLINTKSSDISNPTNSYSILARQKLLGASNVVTRNFSNQSIVRQQRSNFDSTNNIQWSSMSTTTDLLF